MSEPVCFGVLTLPFKAGSSSILWKMESHRTQHGSELSSYCRAAGRSCSPHFLGDKLETESSGYLSQTRVSGPGG